jgi:hypothetical protein
LSAQSRRLRFLTPKQALSPAELRYSTDVDHHPHEAVGALNHADGRDVGIARYIRDADDPQAAEIAVIIIEDRQGQGLGTEQAGGSAMPVIRHHRLRVGAGLHVVGWVGGWRSWTPVFICR